MSLRIDRNKRILDPKNNGLNQIPQIDNSYLDQNLRTRSGNKKPRAKGGKQTIVTPFKSFRKNPEFSVDRNQK